MQAPPWLTTFWQWFAGHDPLRRRHVLICVASGQIYGVTLAVMWHAVWLDLMSAPLASVISTLMVVTWTTIFLLVRSGWSARCADPVLAMPHAMVAIFNTVVAYAWLGDLRADVFVLLAQCIAVTMFRIQPRQSLLLGFWCVGLLLAAQYWLVNHSGQVIEREAVVAHAVVGGATLLALSLVANWVAELRQKISRQSQRLQDTLAQVQSLATTDMLTGLLNRRQMEEVLATEMARAVRSGSPLCVALLDLDHFKRVNDVYGHRMGDEVLRRFASLLRTEMRAVDHSARWGGEEFIILMPHADLEQAGVALERIRARLADMPMSDHDPLRVTMSGGLAAWTPGTALEHWLDQADQALYAAKHLGRNRVSAAPRAMVPRADEPGVRPLRSGFSPTLDPGGA